VHNLPDRVRFPAPQQKFLRNFCGDGVAKPHNVPVYSILHCVGFFIGFGGIGVSFTHLITPQSRIIPSVFYVYLLCSQKDHNFYTDYTSDLKRRIKEHLNGEELSTKFRRPFKLIYYEAYLLKQDAESREKYLKISMGRRVIRKQLTNYLKLTGSVRATHVE
jgi:putative endonuclease